MSSLLEFVLASKRQGEIAQLTWVNKHFEVNFDVYHATKVEFEQPVGLDSMWGLWSNRRKCAA